MQLYVALHNAIALVIDNSWNQQIMLQYEIQKLAQFT